MSEYIGSKIHNFMNKIWINQHRVITEYNVFDKFSIINNELRIVNYKNWKFVDFYFSWGKYYNTS